MSGNQVPLYLITTYREAVRAGWMASMISGPKAGDHALTLCRPDGRTETLGDYEGCARVLAELNAPGEPIAVAVSLENSCLVLAKCPTCHKALGSGAGKLLNYYQREVAEDPVRFCPNCGQKCVLPVLPSSVTIRRP
jgi:hypothetical protein